jgi:hypothetical protein
MAKVEHPLDALRNFLPDGSFEPVVHLINLYKVHLTVTKERKSVLGDYRHPNQGSNHKITVNGNLNKYEFLITLLHELAHLLCFEEFKNRVEPHGKEWKNIYSALLAQFMQLPIFPIDIHKSLQKTLMNPAATANGETKLLLVLRKYNEIKKEGYSFIAHLPEGALFESLKGRVFKRGKKRRIRIECIEIATGQVYSFSALTEVKLIQSQI